MRARHALCLLFSVLISGACGGRLVHSESDDGGGSSNGASPGSGGSFGAGATANTGATSSRGGRSGVGGTVAGGGTFNTAGTSFAGGVSVAGTPSVGGGCACPAIACGPGYVAVPNANGCCFHCESACSNVLCPGIACGSGSHLEVLAGQCCATCVQDSCAAQQAGYQALRQQLIEKYSTLGCMTNTDCTVYYEKNQCGYSCGVAMPTAAISNLDGNLQNYAQSSCSPDCMQPVPPCAPPPTPICFRGLCQ